MKKILLIAYHYHPDLAIGAQRTVKFAKYLPQFGWAPEVLTVHWRHYSHRDDSELEFDCPVFRTTKWPLPDHIYKTVREWFPRRREHKPVSGSAPGATVSKSGKQPTPWLKKFLNSLSSTPDDSLGWYVPAVFKGWQLCRRQKYDVIYTSGPPHSCHLVGLTLRSLTGIPWVADFRDPWLYPKQRDRHVLEWTKNFDRNYEKRTARKASLVLTTTDEWRDHLRQLYSPVLDHKCHTIVNGFDEDDFDPGTEPEPGDSNAPVTFLYAGNLYYGRDPSTMLVALGELLAQGILNPTDVVFEFYGNNDIDMARIGQIVTDFGLQAVVRFHEPVGRDAYLKLLRGADVLILIQSDAGRVHIPAKAFEYLGTGSDILTLTSEGATRSFMSRFEQASIAALDDKEEIKEAVKRLYHRARKRDTSGDIAEGLKSITRYHLTGQFVDLLNGILAGNKR